MSDRLLLPGRAVVLHRDEGLSTAEIAAQFGVARPQVFGWFRMMGYDPIEGRGDRLIAEYLDGATGDELAEIAGIAAWDGNRLRRFYEMLAARGVERLTQQELRERREERRLRGDPSRCNRCTILLTEEDAPDDGVKDGLCRLCREELATGRICGPGEFEMMREELG
jgi:hypothetical protein